MTTITKERAEIKSFINGFLSDRAHDNQSSNSLLANVFRIALASLVAEPVAYQYRQWDAEYDEWGEWEDCGEYAFERFVEEEKCQGAGVQTRKLYATPPMLVVPDERAAYELFMEKHFGDSVDRRRAKNGDSEYMAWDMAIGWIIWCHRAAMFQAGNFRENKNSSTSSPATKDGWISCSERMPEETGDIIVVSDGIVMSGISYSRRDGFYIAALEYDDDEPIDGVTHWMPLPEPPQEVK
ncbi:DUF551 domain-containing protein [Escherichia coli]|jgi:hypothetical protein|uniref:DUF551 domain-containing protein n=1 Tax=Escherichia coli TaxID=562 RepID=UPI000390F8D8|nr:DUF551 domain-containing protein [Escherichia coli]EFC5160160.1 DUF551 domain-containing protein [Escherichia coli]EFM6126356.1 DUF551 domain-containing protein [Escherichia coli]EGL0723108.1 DUF551 domain-containing protein [Escherichia coli]EGL0968891.1 DUF551 domain-containing protein [Escherichia coli]EQN85304.1 hypothetical protein G700_01757 [Escherichia coli HVH 24 (4-5985145)]